MAPSFVTGPWPSAASGELPGQGGERDVRVGQRARINLGARPDQGFDVGVDVPDVDVHAGQDPAVPQPEGDELTTGPVAAEHHFIPLPRVSRVLHADVV